MGLSESDVGDDPIPEVARWVEDAVAAGVAEPYAMQLATVDDGRPSARTVLLRTLDQRGFMFVTNLESRKGRELAANPACALVLVWTPLKRQVLVTGTAERVPDDEVEVYWHTRPRGSRIGAWASPQSQVIADRAVLERAAAEVEARFAGTDDLPLPPFWGAWRVVPATVELWCGRDDRLHDRLRWRRDAPGQAWIRERLAP
ncbi:MAG: Pyridoxine/pyridoxamine 5-phosphate oxidase [Acidimicrobiales bacterium]|nr:Pyridoxine/pyridoxamine 5-phosphate oxidase [Acidimicrobiales bacterium]